MRRDLLRPAVALLAVLLLAGCVKPSLTRRYSNAKWETQAPTHVRVSVFVLAPPKAKGAAPVLSLSDRGQKALIESVFARSTTNADLLKTLGDPLGKQAGRGTVVDRTRYKKRLVLSAERVGPYARVPADRIHYLRFTLDGLVNGSFASWDRFSTQYQTVDLGKVSLSQTGSVSGTLSAGPSVGAVTPVSGSATGSYSRTLSEEVSLRQRYVQLTGILDANGAHLIQEGVVGIDLAGNAVVDVELEVPAQPVLEPVFSISPLKTNQNFTDQDKLEVAIFYLRYPQTAVDVTFDYTADYTLRHVRWHGRSVAEGDDWVTFVDGSIPKVSSKVLVPAEELKTLVYEIERRAPGVAPQKLGIEGPSGGTLAFSSFDEVRDFMGWLRNKGAQQTGAIRVGNRKLKLGPNDVDRAAVASLRLAPPRALN